MQKCDKMSKTEIIEPIHNERNTSTKNWGEFNSMIKKYFCARRIKEIIRIIGSREDKLIKKIMSN